MQVTIDGLDVLTISILVIFLGRYLTTHVAFLDRYHIPPAVTGGLLCSFLTAMVVDVIITNVADLIGRELHRPTIPPPGNSVSSCSSA